MAAQLIPGLPNDIAFHCLLLLPPKLHPRMKSVSSLWKIVLESDRFYAQRRRQFVSPSLFLVRCLGDRLDCLDVDIDDHSIHRILFSCDLDIAQVLFPQGSVCASVRKSVLVVGCKTGELDLPRGVGVFNIITRKWVPGSKMISPRSNFAFASMDNRLFVFGDDSGADEVSTDAEVYDHTRNRWDPIMSLPVALRIDTCFPLDGKLFVRGTLANPPWPIVAYFYDPSKNQWEEDLEMTNRLSGVVQGSKVASRPDGTLFVATVKETAENRAVDVKMQRQGGQWTNMVIIPINASGEVFIFNEGQKIVLVIPSADGRLRFQYFPFFPLFKILHVPCSELRAATLMQLVWLDLGGLLIAGLISGFHKFVSSYLELLIWVDSW